MSTLSFPPAEVRWKFPLVPLLSHLQLEPRTTMTTTETVAPSHTTFPSMLVDGVRVFAPQGHLIVGNRQALKQLVIDAIEARDERRFVFDFRNTGYIDASGLGVLVSIQKRVRDVGGACVMFGLNDDLMTLLEITKFDTVFRVTTTLERALDAVAIA